MEAFAKRIRVEWSHACSLDDSKCSKASVFVQPFDQVEDCDTNKIAIIYIFWHNPSAEAYGLYWKVTIGFIYVVNCLGDDDDLHLKYF